MLLVGSDNGQINILDLTPSSASVHFEPIGAVSAGVHHQNPIISLEWFPGDRGIFYSLDTRGQIHIWDAQMLVPAESKRVKKFKPSCGAFRVNGKQIAIAGAELRKK